MVAFEEGIHDELPIPRDLVRLAAEQHLFAHAQRVEVLADGFGHAEVGGLFLRAEPNQPAGLPAWQFDQAVFALVQTGEGVGPGEGKQPSVNRISPGMIGADQLLGALHLAALDQPRAAVAADVEEDMRFACGIARDQQRASGGIVRHSHARIG